MIRRHSGGTSYARPLRIGIGAGGSLRIEYGEAGTYFFVLPPYPWRAAWAEIAAAPGGTGADGEDGGYYTRQSAVRACCPGPPASPTWQPWAAQTWAH